MLSDRAVPQCMVYVQTGQTYNYPLQPMKPGPKIGKGWLYLITDKKQFRLHWQDSGSLQKRREYRRSNNLAQNRRVSSQSSPSNNPNLRSDYSKPEIEGPGSTNYTEIIPRTAIYRGDRPQTSHLNIHDLSYILHPSHESTTPNRDKSQSPSSNNQGKSRLYPQAYAKLGVSQTIMNQI